MGRKKHLKNLDMIMEQCVMEQFLKQDSESKKNIKKISKHWDHSACYKIIEYQQ